MPTYVYRRKDGTTFEIEQRITDPSLKECPTTGQPVTRLISPGAGLVFKGSGFYLTDYARAGKNGRSSGTSSTSSSESSSAGSDESKSASDSSRTEKSDSPSKGSASGEEKGEK